jgi:hypothetical protein
VRSLNVSERVSHNQRDIEGVSWNDMSDYLMSLFCSVSCQLLLKFAEMIGLCNILMVSDSQVQE